MSGKSCTGRFYFQKIRNYCLIVPPHRALNIALWLVGWDKYALSQIAYAEVSFAVCFVIQHHTADSESQLHAGKGEFLLQMDLFAGIYVVARVGRQRSLQPILRQGHGLARHVGNGVGLALAAGLIGHGRLADQLAVAHGEAILKRHLFADGQRWRTQLLAADTLVADGDVAQLDVARVGKGVFHRDLLPLARARRRKGIRRSQLRRGGLGLDGHRHGADNLIRTVSGIDVILNVILDFAFFDLVLRHVPRAGIGHALLALQAVIRAHGHAAGRIIERDFLGHIRLAAVVNLDGDRDVLLGDDGLRFAERGDADGVGLRHRKSRNGEQEHQHHRGGGQAKPS